MWRHQTSRNPEVVSFGEVCTCATGHCTISALLGPFHRKWHHQTSRHPERFPRKIWERSYATRNCAISDQKSPVGFPLDGWDVRMRDRKCPIMNLLNPTQKWIEINSQEIWPIRSRHFRPISQSDCKKWTNQNRDAFDL